MPGGPAAEGARVGYADQPMPGPETSVGRSTSLPANGGSGAGTGAPFDARLDQAEAGARTTVTAPIAIAGTITSADEDSIEVRTTGGERVELLVPLPQEEYRSGMQVGPRGELRPGDEIRATYRPSEGKKVADTIEVTRPAGP